MEFKFFVFATVTAIHYSVKHTTRQDCNITLSKGGFYLRFFPLAFSLALVRLFVVAATVPDNTFMILRYYLSAEEITF